MIYEYQCPACDRVQELQRPVDKRDDPVTCPDHPETPCKRLVSRQTGMSLRGSGWYRDGYGLSEGSQ